MYFTAVGDSASLRLRVICLLISFSVIQGDVLEVFQHEKAVRVQFFGDENERDTIHIASL